jgi:hypothetical protein
MTGQSGTDNLEAEFDKCLWKQWFDIIEQPGEHYLNNEVRRIGSIKYIVSNLVLTGTDHVYLQKAKLFYNGQVGNPESLTTWLENIPAGNYTKVTCTIGVDKSTMGT